MIKRFRGVSGRRLLVEALRSQKALGRDEAIANAITAKLTLRSVRRGSLLIKQGASDSKIYFVISGNFAVLVNGREVATRAAGEHVGEMTLLDAGARRSATVVATEPSVVASLTERGFTAIADEHPRLWRAFAKELAARLRQRGRFHFQANSTPVLFIGSSREALPIGRAIAAALPARLVCVRLWSKGVFGASRFPMEDLDAQLRSADFALLVAPPDDRLTSRGQSFDAPRDNVVFELGLFMGAISRHRTFLLLPRGVNLKIPSDLLGLTPLQYDPRVKALRKATSRARSELLRTIKSLGPR